MAEFRGRLRWNDFAGGFWSLETDPAEHDGTDNFVLVDPPGADAFEDGADVLLEGTVDRDRGDIVMAGPRMHVARVELV